MITGTGGSMGRATALARLDDPADCQALVELAVGTHTMNKAGIVGMTRQMAMEGRAHGIRANSISQGLIETGATRHQLEDPEWASYMLAHISPESTSSSMEG